MAFLGDLNKVKLKKRKKKKKTAEQLEKEREVEHKNTICFVLFCLFVLSNKKGQLKTLWNQRKQFCHNFSARKDCFPQPILFV